MQKARRRPCGLRQLVDIRFQVLFHSPHGVLFTFPSRYCYTIGHMRVFSLTRWSWQIQTEFLVFRPTWENDPTRLLLFGYGAITLYGWTFPDSILLSKSFLTRRRFCHTFRSLPATPTLLKWQSWHNIGLGCSHFARRYFGNHCCFLFLQVLRCFTSLRWLLPPYIFRWQFSGITRKGFSHSEIPGLKVVCTYPRLIAAYHALHRLHMPRHPPNALTNLIKAFYFSR